MKGNELLEKMSLVDAIYIEEAEKKAFTGEQRNKHWMRRKIVGILVAVLSLILMGAGFASVVMGDLWIQNPSNNPVESVRLALENQLKKDYARRIEIKSVCVDKEETQRVVERFIRGIIAERRGWSNEYLAEHFLVVKAEYYAEYDHDKTTRSDGNVTQFFYLTRNIESGKWDIVDNSGNVNWSQISVDDKNCDADSTTDKKIDLMTSYEEQLFNYMSELYNTVYSPYYDGLHYKIRFDKITTSADEWKAQFLWTMYHLGKGWDIASDEGVEHEGNLHLEATVKITSDGTLDFDSVEILADSGANGPAVYNIPLEEFFPKQFAEE